MASTLPGIGSDCCTTCTTPVEVNVPGPEGPAATPCTPCTDGQNAFTTIVGGTTLVPAFGDSVTVEFVSTDWMSYQQVIFLGPTSILGPTVYGYYLVESVIDSTHASITNLGYTGNLDGNGIIAFAAGTRVQPGGLQGPTGPSSGSAFQIANNLSEGVPATMRTNLGLGALAVLNTVNDGDWSGTDLAVANGGTGSSTAAGARTNLAAAGSGLATASGLTVSATDKVLGRSSAGAGPVEEIDCTSAGRALIDDASAAVQRETLGKVGVRYGLLGSLTAVDLNVATSDNAVTMVSSRYRLDKVTVENASLNLTTATAGVFTAAGGGGTTLAADQALSALTASAKFIDLTLQAVAGTDVMTSGTLYFRVGTAQGAAATANVWLWGYRFD